MVFDSYPYFLLRILILFSFFYFFSCQFFFSSFFISHFLFLASCYFFSSLFREKLNQLGFSWELPTHTKRKRKGDEDLTATTDPLLEDGVTSTEEKKVDIEVVAEIVPVVMTGGGSSKWPHEVRLLPKKNQFRHILKCAIFISCSTF